MLIFIHGGHSPVVEQIHAFYRYSKGFSIRQMIRELQLSCEKQ